MTVPNSDSASTAGARILYQTKRDGEFARGEFTVPDCNKLCVLTRAELTVADCAKLCEFCRAELAVPDSTRLYPTVPDCESSLRARRLK